MSRKHIKNKPISVSNVVSGDGVFGFSNVNITHRYVRVYKRNKRLLTAPGLRDYPYSCMELFF